MNVQKAIFLDRDGTLNVDTGYVFRRADWQWLPGAKEGLKILADAGFLLLVVSNQSGIARGFYTKDDLAILERDIGAELASFGAPITAWYSCPHLPSISGPCSCRKPKPGMLLLAAKNQGISLANSWMIGDRLRDIEAGCAAGVRTVKLGSNDCSEDHAAAALGARCLPTLLAAAKWITQTS